MNKQELRQALLNKGIKCEDLDDTVHDAASIIASKASNSGTGLNDDAAHDAASVLASNANNGGLDAQIDFLMDTCGWSTDDILKQI
jgi:hypothetical protein